MTIDHPDLLGVEESTLVRKKTTAKSPKARARFLLELGDLDVEFHTDLEASQKGKLRLHPFSNDYRSLLSSA
eukprot:SAG22_NODE_1554_length_4137_cov_3.159485_6_plen_71_part_01